MLAQLQAGDLHALPQLRERKFFTMVLLLCFAGLQLEVARCIGTAVRREELGCRSYRRASCEAAPNRSSSDMWLLREEVRSLSHKEFSHPSIHPSIHPSTHPSIHSFIRSFVPSFLPSFLRSFVHSFVHSFMRSFTDSLTH